MTGTTYESIRVIVSYPSYTVTADFRGPGSHATAKQWTEQQTRTSAPPPDGERFVASCTSASRSAEHPRL